MRHSTNSPVAAFRTFVILRPFFITMLILAGRLMTTAFVFITVVAIAHAIHVLLAVDHLLLVLVGWEKRARLGKRERESLFANVFEWITFFSSLVLLFFFFFAYPRICNESSTSNVHSRKIELPHEGGETSTVATVDSGVAKAIEWGEKGNNLDFQTSKEKLSREFFDEAAVGRVKRGEKIGNRRLKFGKFPTDSWLAT
jgi:hypothetical protein